MTDELIKPRPAVARLEAYDPQHLEVPTNLSANENSYGLPDDIRAKLAGLVEILAFNRYPDPAAVELRRVIAARHGVVMENVAVGNGGDELIQALLLAYGGANRTAVAFGPTFVMYGILSDITATSFAGLSRDARFDIPADAAAAVKAAGGDIVFACSPNNPTGNVIDEAAARALAGGVDGLVVIDEAYQEFSETTTVELLGDYRNLAVLRTFSKAFSLAGLRVGYLLADAEVIENINKVRLPYNVNVFSQAAAAALMAEAGPLEVIIAEIVRERSRLAAALAGLDGYLAYPSAANFLLVRCSRSADEVWRGLIDAGILVRNLSSVSGLDGCLRVTVGTPAQNDLVIEALGRLA